jgi:hypothetical protein
VVIKDKETKKQKLIIKERRKEMKDNFFLIYYIVLTLLKELPAVAEEIKINPAIAEKIMEDPRKTIKKILEYLEHLEDYFSEEITDFKVTDFSKVIFSDSDSGLIDCSVLPAVPRPDWKIAEHRFVEKIFKWEPERVELYLSEKQKYRNYTDGKTLYQEMKDKKVLNFNVLNYLINHPQLIPREWSSPGNCIFFWGTIFKNEYDCLFVSCLRWDSERYSWVLDYNSLSDGFWHRKHYSAVIKD